MIRWRFLISRILLLLLAILALWLGAAPLLHLALQHSLQSAVGARVDIDQLRIGWWPPRLMVRGIAVADPDREHENLLSAGRVIAQFDGYALLHGRLVVAEARVEDLDFSTERATSGRLAPAKPDEAPDAASSWTSQVVSDFVDRMADQTESRAESLAGSLVTPQTAKQIADRWQAQYRDLRTRSEQLKQSVQLIKGSARAIENPLRDLPVLEQSLREALRVRQEVLALRDAANAVPQQLQQDWQTIDQARRTDQQRLSELAGVPLDQMKLDGRWLMAVARAQFETIRPHLETAQRLADATVVAPKPPRCRGREVDFHRGPALPDIFCQHCEISGRLSHDRESYQVVGSIENYSWQTDRLAAHHLPVVAKLRLSGPHALQVNFIRHFETSPRTDILRIHLPSIPAAAQQLGEKSRFAVAISAAPLDVWMDLTTQGSHMDGRLMVRQPAVQITASGDERLARFGLIESLNRGLSRIDRFELDARLQGDWRNPEFAVSSNLEPALRDGFRLAAVEQWAHVRQRAYQEVDAAHRKATAELEGWLQQQQQELQQELASVQSLVNEATQQLTELQRPQFYLGKLREQLPQR
jgi:uncharacterized protein (TIGR03545 family)